VSQKQNPEAISTLALPPKQISETNFVPHFSKNRPFCLNATIASAPNRFPEQNATIATAPNRFSEENATIATTPNRFPEEKTTIRASHQIYPPPMPQ
jgi:hypothetical protein